MLDTDRSEHILDGEILDAQILDADEPASVELVPVTPAVRWSQRPAIARPDAIFVTHLIATADQAPQTRSLRRGSLADAQTAYGASQIRHYGVGFRTRQVI
jgi:hypothetical protein